METISQTLPKAPQLKDEVLAAARELLRLYKLDIESGLEDGLYEKGENVESLAFIKRTEELLDMYEHFAPTTYVLLSGGMVQGAHANTQINIEVFDLDTFKCLDGSLDDEELTEFIANNGTYDDWNKRLTEGESSGELIAVL